ncbi:Probable FAD-linked sulfhydryl oxidase R368 [Durusdinium trenchii]|uniref:Sulfhydryl oxidase n=1 Tax=Durusdinium trenchii TaxID=1381693 RepID=A0ABP0M7Q0_9DINO
MRKADGPRPWTETTGSVEGTGLNVLNNSARNDTATENFTLPSAEGFRDTKVWGPPTWFFLHSLTLALPEEVPREQQAQIKNLLVSLREVLPCAQCSDHWREQMEEDPVEPHLAHRGSMVKWMIRMHNKVNQRNGLKLQTEAEVLEEYQLAYDKFGRWGGFQAVLGPKIEKSYSTSKVLPSPFIAAVLLFACLMPQGG